MQTTMKAAAFALLLAFGATSAQATTSLVEKHSTSFSAGSGSDTDGSVFDFFSFTLSSLSDLTINAKNKGIVGAADLYYGDDLVGQFDIDTLKGPSNFFTGSFAGYSFAAGEYTLAFDGLMLGSKGSTSFSVYATPAIPEPETYAMLLAGLGVLGAVARRRMA